MSPSGNSISSPRELVVAEAIRRAISNAAITAELLVSVTTVKTHIGRVLDQLEVTHRVQIATCVQDALR